MDQADFEELIASKPLPVYRKARSACDVCRARKQQCDFRPEGCSRCRDSGIQCEYTGITNTRVKTEALSTENSGTEGSGSVLPALPSDVRKSQDRRKSSGTRAYSSTVVSGSISGADSGLEQSSPESREGLIGGGTRQSEGSFVVVTAEGNAGTDLGLALIPVAAGPTYFRQFAPLPDSDNLNLCLSLHFEEMENVILPNVSTARLSSRAVIRTIGVGQGGTSLLLSSILLLSPQINLLSGSALPSTEGWEKSFFPWVKAELYALLASAEPRRFSVEDCSALFNLAIWAMFRGLVSLRRQILILLTRACSDLLQETARQGNTPPTSSRDAWLSYWELQRTYIAVLTFLWRQTEWTMDIYGNHEFDIDRLLSRPAAPTANVWAEALRNPHFNPSQQPRRPLHSHVLAFLKYPSNYPRRQALLQFYGPLIFETRGSIQFVTIILRQRLDRFLVACQLAGLESPADLQTEVATYLEPETYKALLAQRDELDATILQIAESFPPDANKALEEGDAPALINFIARDTGSTVYAFNCAPQCGTLRMMRLELYTSFGILFTKPDANMELASYKLADEILAAGPVSGRLLEEALLYTRFLQSWMLFNPTLNHHTITSIPLIFRTFFLHLSFRKKFMSMGQTAAAHQQVLADVDYNFAVCLDVLRRYAVKSAWLSNIYDLALKMASEIQITDKDVEKVTWKTEMVDDEETLWGAEAAPPQLDGFVTLYSNSSM